jgi:enterochelin esterase family protein
MSPIPQPDSPKIRRLQRSLRGHRKNAEERFWLTVSRTKAPLVEPVRGDSTRSWVTYLWRGDTGTRSVGVSSPQTEFGKIDNVSRLPGSRVWFRTAKVKDDSMGGYCLIPNPPRLDFDDLFEYLRVLKRGRTDPLNPLQFVSPPDPEFPDHPIYGMTYSVLQLAEAPNHSEVVPRAGAPKGSLKQYYLRSRILKNRRRVWTYIPPGVRKNDPRANLVVFFDGFAYVNEISAPTILDNLIAKGRIFPTYALFVDALDMPTRASELTCNPEFGRFLTKELLPWSRRILGRSFPGTKTTLAGFSYGGLCSLYWGMRYPKRFGGVISQSGSFWWAPKGSPEPVALAKEFMRRPRLPLRIYMDAGRYEGAADSENGAGHLGANRHLRDVFRTKGYPVRYQTYNGGHDSFCWRQTLVEALPSVLT